MANSIKELQQDGLCHRIVWNRPSSMTNSIKELQQDGLSQDCVEQAVIDDKQYQTPMQQE